MQLQSDIAAERRKNVATAEGRGRRFKKKREPPLDAKVLLHCNFKVMCERPPRSLRSLSPSRGGDYIFSPSVRGESRRRRQGGAPTPSRIGVGQQPPSAVATFFRRSAAGNFFVFI